MKEHTHLKWYQSTLKEYLTQDEIQGIMKKSNWKATFEIIYIWFWIVFAFALVAIFPNLLTIIIALFILGGQQLACAIIMHDSSHDSLFTSRKANAIIGNWFGAYPIFLDVLRYRPYHVQHHMTTGLSEDPDISLTKGYPTTIASMARKFFRDLSGATGIKGYIGIFAMHFGYLKFNLGGLIERMNHSETSFKDRIISSAHNITGPIIANLLIFAALWLLGHPWLYLLWIGSLLTTYNFCLRVRSMAEHSMVPDQEDPHRNTRTIYANWVERMLFAPLHVNYHMEHHLLMGAPSYNYPQMHKYLRDRGYYKKGILAENYWQIIKQAIIPSKKATV